MAKIESVNPDARIKVATVLPNGLLTIWNPVRNGVRPFAPYIQVCVVNKIYAELDRRIFIRFQQ